MTTEPNKNNSIYGKKQQDEKDNSWFTALQSNIDPFVSNAVDCVGRIGKGFENKTRTAKDHTLVLVDRVKSKITEFEEIGPLFPGAAVLPVAIVSSVLLAKKPVLRVSLPILSTGIVCAIFFRPHCQVFWRNLSSEWNRRNKE